MAFPISVPFFAMKLKFNDEIELSSPILDRDALRINTAIHLLAGKYANEFQRKILNAGNLHKLFEENHPVSYEKESITISFKASKDKISYPDFELDFDYFFKKTAEGLWGFVPAVGVESVGSNITELIENLEEAVRLEFVRNRRMSQVNKIVSVIWWKSVELVAAIMLLDTPTPREIENMDGQSQELLLPKVATRLNIMNEDVFGREKEIEQFERAILSKFNKNVLLVGPSGVGKTALVYELSRITDHLHSIWMTTPSSLIKNCSGDTGWQENLATLCEELKQTNDFLYISNLMELFEVGQYQGNDVSMAMFLTPYIARGEINMIAECTEEELAKIDLKQPNYLSLFQIIQVEEPTDRLNEIIVKKIEKIAKSRSLKVERKAIEETLRLNKRFTPYSGLPGKPIRFLESVIITKSIHSGNNNIWRKDVIQAFSEASGLPLFMIDPDIPMDTKAIKGQFNSNVYGQEKAVSAVVDMLASVKTALARTGQPIASFLFVGPTGVGKTEMARVLSKFMFGSSENMVRFDMSEFSSGYAMSRLIGESYNSSGLLTSAVRQNPFCVLLFDEIEKAHPSVYDIFLQILGEGRLSVPSGEVVNFCSTIIIMTSNIGAKKMMSHQISMTGGSDEVNKQDVSDFFTGAVQRFFRPELYNRFDQVIPFEPLDQDTMRFVVEREIELLKKREGIRFRKMNFTIDDEVLYYLAKKGYDIKYGARQLQRTIRDEVTAPLSTALNNYGFEDQLIVKIDIENDAPTIQIESDPLGVDLFFEELDKITDADYASTLRRQINSLQQGNYYIRLLSQLDIMENEKKRLKKDFWKDNVRAKKYSNLLETKSRMDTFHQKIVDIENEHANVVMDLQPYTDQMSKDLEQWKEDFVSLKMEVYSRKEEGADVALVYVYGFHLEPIIKFYRALFDYKQYDYEMRSIWFQKHDPSELNENGDAPEPYYFSKLNKNKDLTINPVNKGDLHCGLLFRVDGPCARLYLSGEDQSVAWWTSDKDKRVYAVEVKGKIELPSGGIHRKDYYSGSKDRIVKPNHLKDISLGINREIGKGDLFDVISEALEERFKVVLDGALG